MGTKLYGDPEVALRELIQNSIDACLLRDAMERSWGNSYSPEISVKYYQKDDDDILEVIDNGTGMDNDIIDNYYSKIGSSFYKSADFYDLKSQTKAEFNPTSRFGIGILSCFMVADTLIVDTRRLYQPHVSSDPINLTIEGQDSIFWIRPGERVSPGTSTKLVMRKSNNPWERMTEEQFFTSVETVVPNPPFKISIETGLQKTVRDETSFNTIRADSLKNHFWDPNKNVREFHIELTDTIKGVVGSAVIAVLESKGSPVPQIKMRSKTVDIEGSPYELKKSLLLVRNNISLVTTSISIDEDGVIDESEGHSTMFESKSRLSLHGIEVPSKLFDNWWRVKKNQAILRWPMPALIVVDVCGSLDLDLNTSRTEILIGESWSRFEEILTKEILTKIADSVPNEYWEQFTKVFLKESKHPVFNDVLQGIVKD